MPLLSIIIPIYNGGAYVATAITSALEQGLKDLEILLVNDGSTDQTEAVCAAFAREHANIRCYSQDNRGASAARNLGLREARDTYVVFVDADDRLLPDCFGGLESSALGGDHDVVMFSSYYANIRRNRYRIDQRYPDIAVPGGRMFPISGAIGACVYRRELLMRHGIRFAEGIRNNEDQVFKLKALYKARTIRMCSRFSYVYQATPGSVSHTLGKSFDYVDAWREAYAWFELHAAAEDKEMALAYVGRKLHSRMLLYAKSCAQKKRSRKQLREELRRVDGLQMLLSIDGSQVMPYQTQDLARFQTKLGTFMFHARWEGRVITLGRWLLRIPAVRALRDRKHYPLTSAPVQPPQKAEGRKQR